MRNSICVLLLLSFSIQPNKTVAQTNKDIRGTWQMISSTISGSDWSYKMDSSTHNLTKIITPGKIIFTIYNRKTDSLEITGQGRATTKGNQYIETFEQSDDKSLLTEPAIFTYKVEGSKLSYEGGTKDFHVVEVLKRIE